MKRGNGSTPHQVGEKRVTIDLAQPEGAPPAPPASPKSAPQTLIYSSPTGYQPYSTGLTNGGSAQHDDDAEVDGILFPGENGGGALRPRSRSNSADPVVAPPNGEATIPSPLVRKRKQKKKTKRPKSSFCKRFYSRWIKGVAASFSSLFLAVILWYVLGVLSIGTSKLLLMQPGGSEQQQHRHKHHHPLIGGVPPLFLTLQQLCIGACLLRFLLSVRFLNSAGVAPWPVPSSLTISGKANRRGSLQRSQSFASDIMDFISTIHPQLFLAGFFFALGFLMTNYGFAGSSASFVETIKAAEPITSAAVAVWNGIETLSNEEGGSLLAIVFGVVMSTLGNSHGSSESHKPAASESIMACVIVMVANLSFSCRGLYQKLFRATPEGSTQLVDDLNLQLRMQQVGIALLLFPVLFWEASVILMNVGSLHRSHGLWSSGVTSHYIILSLLNGFAFTSYNLASTYILSRISVVHHAALNCVRRVFAIVLTSIYFVVPITFIGGFGILISFGGFMSFTHFKVQRQRKPKPLSSLLPVSVGSG